MLSVVKALVLLNMASLKLENGKAIMSVVTLLLSRLLRIDVAGRRNSDHMNLFVLAELLVSRMVTEVSH